MRPSLKKHRIIIFFWSDGDDRLVPLVHQHRHGQRLLLWTSLGGLITAAVTEGKEGLLTIWRRMTRWMVSLRWYLVGCKSRPNANSLVES